MYIVLYMYACVCVCVFVCVRVQCCEVPQWMFIGWISQMLPLMDKAAGEAVEGILHSIAVTYPQVTIILSLSLPISNPTSCFAGFLHTLSHYC